MAKLVTGETAPAFELLNADAKPVRLADFADHRLILYFFPAALTPGCTKEALDFQDALSQVQAAGYLVAGVSPDAPAKLARFRDEHALKFPLLSDPDRQTIEAYGAYGTKMLYGKEVAGVIRSTFVIEVDAAGVGMVTGALYNVRATGHVDRIRRELGI